MNKILLLFLFWLICGNLYAQVQWGHQLSSEGRVNLEQHTVDEDGNIIGIGNFEGTVNIGNEKLTSMGSTDIFIFKSSSDGEVLWTKAFNSPSHSGDVGVATDKLGNIYVTGGFVSELYSEGTHLLKGNNSWNAFLIKMDQNGVINWTESVLGGEVRTWGVISANSEGEVVIGVNFTTQAQLSTHIFKSGMGGGSNLLVLKFSTDGVLQWYVHPPLMSNTRAQTIHLGENGKVYLTGFYTNSFELEQYHIRATSPNHGDIFVAKFDKGGKVDWLKGFNKTTAVSINNKGSALYVNLNTEEVYITGTFKGSVDFDGTVIDGINTAEHPASADIFLTRLAADGTVIWAKRFGTDNHDLVWDLKRDAAGNLMFAGSWTGRPAVQLFDENGTLGDYISLNTSGTALNVSPFGEGGYYLSGYFYNLFDEGAFNWHAKGTQDGFLVKIAACQADSQPLKPELSFTCSDIRVTNSIVQGRVKWFRNGLEVSSEEPYRFVSPQIGIYQVGFENNCGITLSEPLHFDNESDLPPLPILQQVHCKRLTIDNQANYTITWYKNGELIPHAQGTSLDILTDGEYSVRFENLCGSSFSSIRAYTTTSVPKYATYNVITPNGDGKNDYFILDPALEGSSLQVYNRWGMKIYENSNYQNNWDGQGLATAVYYWVISNECAGKLKGSVTIIR